MGRGGCSFGIKNIVYISVLVTAVLAYQEVVFHKHCVSVLMKTLWLQGVL